MQMQQLLAPSRVIVDMAVDDKKAVLSQMAEILAADLPDVSAGEILQVFKEREQLGTTGIGQGIAIPHGKLVGITTPMAALARVSGGIDFDAMDGKSVHLVMALLSPLGSSVPHLKALSSISRLLRSQASRDRLLAASDAQALFEATLAFNEE
ncbi:MAG: PTS sugar transporter subunit IIA [Magnetococcales bacterium]|nr:PTS sugar transporter subunit IIA [Magnetococcales bacterium]